jgi:hypothetical protein
MQFSRSALMPDDTGKMSKEEMDKALAWVSSHQSGDIVCSICKTKRWIVSEHTVSAPRYGKTGHSLNGESYPHVMMNCGNCGHAIFIGAVYIGLFPASGDE